MSIAVFCANCGHQAKAPDSAAGRRSKCPRCGTPLRIPFPETPATTSEPQASTDWSLLGGAVPAAPKNIDCPTARPASLPTPAQASPAVEPVALPPTQPATETPATLLIAGIHRQRFAVACCAATGMMATFLPWAHVPLFGSVSGTVGDGWITLCLFAPAMLMVFLDATTKPMAVWEVLVAVVPALIASAIGFYTIANFNNTLSRNSDNIFLAASRIGEGLYLLAIAGPALTISIVFTKSDGR